jgi:hypothetical protein
LRQALTGKALPAELRGENAEPRGEPQDGGGSRPRVRVPSAHAREAPWRRRRTLRLDRRHAGGGNKPPRNRSHRLGCPPRQEGEDNDGDDDEEKEENRQENAEEEEAEEEACEPEKKLRRTSKTASQPRQR